MKNIIYSIGIIFASLLFLSSCVWGGLDPGISIASETTSDQDDESDRGGLCEGDSGCEDICEDVYDDNDNDDDDGKIELCLDLPYKTAIQFEDIIDILEEPSNSLLRGIKSKVFSKFLGVSLGPWISATDDSISDSEAKALLAWVVHGKGIAQAIVNAYKDTYENYVQYEGIDNLFKEIAGSVSVGEGCSGNAQKCAKMLNAAVVQDIQGNKSFLDIVVETKSTPATTILCNIFKQKCDEVNSGDVSSCGASYSTHHTATKAQCP